MLFEKIKENPQACERLMETFYDALGVGDDYEGNGLSAEQFATALFPWKNCCHKNTLPFLNLAIFYYKEYF